MKGKQATMIGSHACRPALVLMMSCFLSQTYAFSSVPFHHQTLAPRHANIITRPTFLAPALQPCWKNSPMVQAPQRLRDVSVSSFGGSGIYLLDVGFTGTIVNTVLGLVRFDIVGGLFCGGHISSVRMFTIKHFDGF